MNVLILGFDKLEEVDQEMEKLVNDSQYFLFNIIAGGLDGGERTSKSIAEQYAELRGAPLIYVFKPDVNSLVSELARKTDFLLMRLDERTPAWQSRLMMKIRMEGKHGKVIR